jgi:hypothetical protein
MGQLKKEIQKNFAMAQVFFQTLNVVNINQIPQLDVSNPFLPYIALLLLV